MNQHEIVYKQTVNLIPYVNNSRTHSEEQINQIAASIKEFGFTNPILTDGDDGIIAGHGRILAASKLGIDSVPCIELIHLSNAQKKAYVIADNKLALNAGWNEELLSLEIGELTEMDFDLGLLGFDSDEIEALISITQDNEGLTDEDAVPDVPEDPITKPGDLWILGNHRLLCGDSTNIDDVERLLNGHKADMMWTDPPYNVSYQGKTKDKLIIDNDNMSDTMFYQFLLDSFVLAFNVIKAGRPAYISHADTNGKDFRAAFVDAGFLLKQCLVWVKNTMVLGRQDYQWQHEPILYGWKPGEAHKWYGKFDQKTVIDDDIDIKKLDKKQLIQIINDYRNSKKTTIIRENKPTSSKSHPTMKPVNLIEEMVLNSSRQEDIIIDPFLGSGSTLIVCEKRDRSCYGMELDEIYCDVIVKRWQDYTGKTAILESTGQEFGEAA